MRKQNTFRPTSLDRLEDRAVPTTLSPILAQSLATLQGAVPQFNFSNLTGRLNTPQMTLATTGTFSRTFFTTQPTGTGTGLRGGINPFFSNAFSFRPTSSSILGSQIAAANSLSVLNSNGLGFNNGFLLNGFGILPSAGFTNGFATTPGTVPVNNGLGFNNGFLLNGFGTNAGFGFSTALNNGLTTNTASTLNNNLLSTGFLNNLFGSTGTLANNPGATALANNGLGFNNAFLLNNLGTGGFGLNNSLLGTGSGINNGFLTSGLGINNGFLTSGINNGLTTTTLPLNNGLMTTGLGLNNGLTTTGLFGVV